MMETEIPKICILLDGRMWNENYGFLDSKWVHKFTRGAYYT